MRTRGDGAPPLRDELVGVDADLDDVVDQGEERRQWEGGHEDGDETVLDHCSR